RLGRARAARARRRAHAGHPRRPQGRPASHRRLPRNGVVVIGALVNGIVIGSGYALLALGWTLLLGAARVVNFAHGQLYMLGAFITWWAMTQLGVPYLVGVVA